MSPESKDTETHDRVDDKNKGIQALADDITKRVATRLVANCNKSARRSLWRHWICLDRQGKAVIDALREGSTVGMVPPPEDRGERAAILAVARLRLCR